jgi:hypothetical protein
LKATKKESKEARKEGKTEGRKDRRKGKKESFSLVEHSQQLTETLYREQ